MAGTGPMVLPEDIRLVPVADLPERTRARFECDDGDFALSRPSARTPTKIVDAESAALLERFRQPLTLVQGIVEHSRARGLDPERTLEEAYPLLAHLVRSGILVPADSDRARAIAPVAGAGRLPGGFESVACVQALEDTELHQVRLPDGRIAALKFARAGAPPTVRAAFAREAALLPLVGGGVVPAVWASGEEDGLPYLVLEWCPGIGLLAAAQELRSGDRPWAEVARLALAVVNAYAQLHAADVLHSDVHPENVLVDASGGVRLIDLGFARLDRPGAALADAPRAGVPFYFEPEYARAARDRAEPPASTRAGEQYAVAALAYQVFTGDFYLDFSLEADELLRQVAEDAPLPFAARRIPAWPAVEAVLGRALAKAPGGRFGSMAEFAAALAAASRTPPDAPGAAAASLARGPDAGARLVADVLARLDPEAALFTGGLPAAPTCSVKLGAAGIAYGLHRLAAARDSADLLAWADVWCARAQRDADAPDAFVNDALDLSASLIGSVSPYHTRAGVQAVAALVARARDDLPAAAAALEAFVADSRAECPTRDLTLGRAGTLVVGALLAEALPPDDTLLALGRDRLRSLWDEVAELPPVDRCAEWPNLGIAHGWGGLAFAGLRWCAATGDPLPPGLTERLDQLAGCAEPWGRGLRWQWRAPETPRSTWGYMPGWCNGSAGLVPLWTLAHRSLGDDRWLRLAEAAAWNAWEDPAEAGNLCCGLAGRAYGLLALYRHTGDRVWLERARVLGRAAAAAERDPELPWYSLYKGELGVAVLVAELADPDAAALPFFEAEGWPAAAPRG
nr:protein kinase [Propionibacterium sp.]